MYAAERLKNLMLKRNDQGSSNKGPRAIPRAFGDDGGCYGLWGGPYAGS